MDIPIPVKILNNNIVFKILINFYKDLKIGIY